MIKKQPSMDSTWARPPTGQNSRPSTGSSTRQTLLPYRPTPSPRPTTYRPTPSNQLPTIVQRELNHDHLTHLPSHSKATFQWMRGELLGQGSYGRVYMALNASTGELMAVKQVELPREDHKPAHQDALRFLAFESKTLRELDHPNIVQYLGCESSAEALSVFLEYVPGGTIATLLHKYGRFREEVTQSFTRQILEGLEYLHTNGIIHRDLKPDNILVEPIGVCKISDFGISKRVDDIHSPRVHTLMRGTVQYMAPEILGSKEKGYDGKIDIWSVGCMVMEMWTGEKPWGAGENFMAIMLKLRETLSPPPLPAQLQKELSPNAHNFRDSCFHINPVQRPSAADLKQHPYLRLPQSWTFNEVEIPHPSRERKIHVGGRKQREHQEDETTYRPKRYAAESQGATIRPQDVTSAAASDTIRQPIPRGPSPPIVVIKPLRTSRSPVPSPSPVEAQEQDNATSESSNTSNSRRSGRRKHVYIVANPGGQEPTASYQYVPPPLPPTSQPYSSHLGASSRYNLGYVPEPLPLPSSRLRSSSTPHIAFTPDLSSSSAYPTHSHSSSKSSNSSGSSLPQSSGTEESATWKRPPATAPLHRTSPSSSSSNSRYEGQYERERRSPSGGHQLRTPPPPTMPPPLPPIQTPPPPLPSRPFPSPSDTPPRAGNGRPITPHRRGNRPNAHDIVRHLGIYFPDHDLDQPVVAAPSVDDLTESFDPILNNEGHNHDDDDILSGPLTSQHAISGSPDRFSRLRPSSVNPLSYRGSSRISSPSNVAASTTPGPYTSQSNAVPYAPGPSNDDSGRISHAKSIRRIVEEQESKRQSNPGRARRRTLWDFKMEELRALPQVPGSGQQQASDNDS